MLAASLYFASFFACLGGTGLVWFLRHEAAVYGTVLRGNAARTIGLAMGVVCGALVAYVMVRNVIPMAILLLGG